MHSKVIRNFHTTSIIMSIFTYNLWILSVKLSIRFEKRLPINLTAPTNFNLQDMIFAVSSPFLPVLFLLVFIRTEKVLYFSVFSPRQINSPSSSLASLVHCEKLMEFL